MADRSRAPRCRVGRDAESPWRRFGDPCPATRERAFTPALKCRAPRPKARWSPHGRVRWHRPLRVDRPVIGRRVRGPSRPGRRGEPRLRDSPAWVPGRPGSAVRPAPYARGPTRAAGLEREGRAGLEGPPAGQGPRPREGQSLLHLAGTGEALPTVLRQRPEQHGIDRRRNLWPQPGRGDGVFADVLMHHGERGVTDEGRAAGEQFVQKAARGVLIGAAVDRSARQLFRRQVGGSPPPYRSRSGEWWSPPPPWRYRSRGP